MKTSTDIREQVAANRTLFFQHRSDLQANLQTLVSMHIAARCDSDSSLYDCTPAEVIAAYVGVVGYPSALELVGSLVNVYSYDGRIFPYVADWAKGLDCAWDGESSLRLGLTSDRIHMCHLNQLAEALMNYELDVADVAEVAVKPVEAEEAEEVEGTETRGIKEKDNLPVIGKNKFKKLAELVADYFKQIMAEEGFATFQEMKKCYWWKTNDVREEICYSVKESGGECYDDMTVIIIGCDEMPYGEFRKLVMRHLK